MSCSVVACDADAVARGWCSSHYARWRRYGAPEIIPTPPTRLERFMEKVSVNENGCWMWLGSLRELGYGQFNLDGRITKAHRAAWMLLRGPIPRGAEICHRCDVPGCVNPDHLFVGSRQDNATDMVQKNRHSFGERNGQAKLTPVDVQSIRVLAAVRVPHEVIADAYSVSRRNVGMIVQRKTWKHVA